MEQALTIVPLGQTHLKDLYLWWYVWYLETSLALALNLKLQTDLQCYTENKSVPIYLE